jgi:CBS domain-containing protein
MHVDPECAHTNDTLRQAALVMAKTGVTRLVVTDRTNPTLPVGVVSLQQLLTDRVRDLHQAIHDERVIRLPRPSVPRSWAGRAPASNPPCLPPSSDG